jgi:predicted RNA binding protein YcfA (HicA-like mRNA interferase family)
MPKLLSSTRVVKVLQREGFIFISQRGSHAKFRRASATVIVPMAKKEIPQGTLRSIIRQSGLAPEKFKK